RKPADVHHRPIPRLVPAGGLSGGGGDRMSTGGGTMDSDRLTIWAPRMLSVLRIMTALLFLEHGTAKLLGFPPSVNQPALLSLFGVQGVIELVGGVLLVLGLFTRPVAFILAGD